MEAGGEDAEGDAGDAAEPLIGPGDDPEPAPNNNRASSSSASSSSSSSGSNSPVDPKKGLSIESYFVNSGGQVVDIDKEGSYKYVLLKVEDGEGGSALLVRGCPHIEKTKCKHANAAERARKELEARGFRTMVMGGGRITRHPSKKISIKAGYVSIFGYSKTFGACEDCNKHACALIKSAFPDHGVKWSNAGYVESDEKKINPTDWTRC
jgi:hypothetical protein